MFDQITKFANDATTTINENRPQRIEDVTGPLADNLAETSNAVLDAVLDTNRRVVDVVVTTADKVRGTLEDTLGDRAVVDARISGALPTPAEAGARYLDFVERAVSVNRDWNDRVVEMIRKDAPQAAAKVTTVATKPVAKKAAVKKAAAKKSVAKKSVAKKAAAKKTVATKSTSAST
ncbi:MAG: hypothetical protein WBP59_03600 [Ilumatobacteraceae bacterium]